MKQQWTQELFMHHKSLWSPSNQTRESKNLRKKSILHITLLSYRIWFNRNSKQASRHTSLGTQLSTINRIRMFNILCELRCLYEYSKTWLIRDSINQNFAIIKILVLTYVPREKFIQIYLVILKTLIIHNSKEKSSL
jgi:hypothetical protein